MKVKCRICGKEIILQDDNPYSRSIGLDPRQQLKEHISDSHMKDMDTLARMNCWIIDLICFTPVTDSDSYEKSIKDTVDYIHKTDYKILKKELTGEE